MLIAQISDPHIAEDGRPLGQVVDTVAYLKRTIAHINALPQKPDLVIASGDLVDKGTANEYEVLRQALAPLQSSFWPLPGNHDNRVALREAFPQLNTYCAADFESPVCYSLFHKNLQIICLDTSVPNAPYGALEFDQLAWLEKQLAAHTPQTACLLFMHHPPFQTGLQHMDGINLRTGQAELAEIIKKNPRVKRICCGHVHRVTQQHWAGCLALTAPSTAHQLVLNFDPKSSAALIFEPPGYLLHWIDEDPDSTQKQPITADSLNIVTHYIPVLETPPIQHYYKDLRPT